MTDTPPKSTVRKLDPPTDKKSEPKDTPPKKTGGRVPDLQKRLEDAFMTVAMIAAPFNQNDGKIIAAHAAPLAEAWYGLSKENAKVKAILERILTVEAGGSVLFVTGSVVLQIGMNHGLIGSLPGVTPPPPEPEPGMNGEGPPGQPHDPLA